MVVERHGSLCVWCSSSYNQKHAIYIPVLSRRICTFTYSRDFPSNERFPTNKPKQPTLVGYALGSPCHEFRLAVRRDNGTLTRVGQSQQLFNNRAQTLLGRRVFRFLGCNPCFFCFQNPCF